MKSHRFDSDRKLKEGEISKTWWGLKDTAIGMIAGLPEKYNVFDITAKKSNLNEFANEISYYNNNKKTLERLGILDLDIKDFEDGIQYFICVNNNIDNLVTRNIADYKDMEITALTPKDLLNLEETKKIIERSEDNNKQNES